MAAKGAKRKVREAKAAMYRQLVLEAAQSVFAEKGYEDTKMEEIAQASGLSLQTLYSVFSGKAALYHELHEAGDRALLQRTGEAPRNADDPIDVLLSGVRAYTTYFMEHPDFLRMHLREGFTWGIVAAGAGSRDRTGAWIEGIEKLTASFQRCIDAGLFVDRDPRLMARMMVAMQQVELAHWIEGGMQGDKEQVVREIAEQVERAFRIPDAARSRDDSVPDRKREGGERRS